MPTNDQIDKLMSRLLGKSAKDFKEEKGSMDEWDQTLQQILQGNVPPRIIRKAPMYARYLQELAEKMDDVDGMRKIVIENRPLVFDDPDFMIYAKAQVEQNRKHGNEDAAKVWEWVI